MSGFSRPDCVAADGAATTLQTIGPARVADSPATRDRTISVCMDGERIAQHADIRRAVDEVVKDLAAGVAMIIPRRRDVRYPLNREVAIGYSRDGSGFQPLCPAWASDLSHNGIGLLVERQFEIGEEWTVELRTSRGRLMLFPCQISHCRPLFSSLFTVGAAFRSDFVRKPNPLRRSA